MVIHQDEINLIDTRRIEDLILVVHYGNNNEQAIVSGIHAIDLAMAVMPSLLEGRRLRWKKNKWIIHNLIGHPLMQILALLKKYDLAMTVHEFTVPKPEDRIYKAG